MSTTPPINEGVVESSGTSIPVVVFFSGLSLVLGIGMLCYRWKKARDERRKEEGMTLQDFLRQNDQDDQDNQDNQDNQEELPNEDAPVV